MSNSTQNKVFNDLPEKDQKDIIRGAMDYAKRKQDEVLDAKKQISNEVDVATDGKDIRIEDSTQNDWAKRFDELFDYRHYDDQNEKWASILDRKDYNPASPEQIKDFIRKELADARREVGNGIEKMYLSVADEDPRYDTVEEIQAYNQAIYEILDTLKEEKI